MTQSCQSVMIPNFGIYDVSFISSCIIFDEFSTEADGWTLPCQADSEALFHLF